MSLVIRPWWVLTKGLEGRDVDTGLVFTSHWKAVGDKSLPKPQIWCFKCKVSSDFPLWGTPLSPFIISIWLTTYLLAVVLPQALVASSFHPPRRVPCLTNWLTNTRPALSIQKVCLSNAFSYISHCAWGRGPQPLSLMQFYNLSLLSKSSQYSVKSRALSVSSFFGLNGRVSHVSPVRWDCWVDGSFQTTLRDPNEMPVNLRGPSLSH